MNFLKTNIKNIRETAMSLVVLAFPLEFEAFNSYFPVSDSFAESISNETVPSGVWMKWIFSDSLIGTLSLVHWILGCGTPSTLATSFKGSPIVVSIVGGSFSFI